MNIAALTMLAAGLGVPLLAALNATLGRQIGSPAAAAVALFAIALLISAIVAIFSGPDAFARLASAPKYLFLGGVFVAFYVLSITYIAPSFGIGNAVFFVLLGQLISAAIIDHFGLFSAQATPLNLNRSAGIALMAAGVFLTQRA